MLGPSRCADVVGSGGWASSRAGGARGGRRARFVGLQRQEAVVVVVAVEGPALLAAVHLVVGRVDSSTSRDRQPRCSPCRDVMVGGEWVVRGSWDGRHPREEMVARAFGAAVR